MLAANCMRESINVSNINDPQRIDVLFIYCFLKHGFGWQILTCTDWAEFAIVYEQQRGN